MAERVIDTRHIPTTFQPLILALAGAGRDMSRLVRGGQTAAAAKPAQDGDQITPGHPAENPASAIFAKALRAADIRWLSCEGQAEVQELSAQGELAVSIDPLNGLANIDANVPTGTIFSVFPAAATGSASFLRPARDQIAAGYIVYGPRCCLMVSFGDGTQMYVLDPDSGVFTLERARVALDSGAPEFAIDASNYRHWPSPVRAYIDDCLAGVDGPREQNFSMRWTGSLVAEAHRILIRGGIFLYPSDSRKGHGSGSLSMVHHCAPIAFLIEQAGGRATNGSESILAGQASSLQARTPFVFGSRDKVDRVAAYHDLPEPEVSALFGNRGLFRA